MANRGKFIVVEGLEGAGKSSAIAYIKSVLAENNIPFVITREPGGTDIGEALRQIIINEPMQAETELLLFYAARLELLTQKIWPALERGEWVITDRFEWSTYAYQGGGRGLDKSVIDNISSLCLKGFKPDLTLYLDITPEIGLERVKLRGNLDRIEKESHEFFDKIRNIYLSLARQQNNVTVIDAIQNLEHVQQRIKMTLANLL